MAQKNMDTLFLDKMSDDHLKYIRKNFNLNVTPQQIINLHRRVLNHFADKYFFVHSITNSIVDEVMQLSPISRTMHRFLMDNDFIDSDDSDDSDDFKNSRSGECISPFQYVPTMDFLDLLNDDAVKADVSDNDIVFVLMIAFLQGNTIRSSSRKS